MLHLRFFSGFAAQYGETPLPRTRTRKEVALLALLALRNGQAVERSWLAGTLWPDSQEAQALAYLRGSLSNLRQVLGAEAYRLVSPTQQTIAFDLTDAFCDVSTFDNALARKDTTSLRHAIELYRGPLLPDCDADWILPERSTREQAFLTALETLATQAMQDSDPPEAVRLLRQILHIEQFRETTHRALLEALASLGDKAGLTLAYRQLRLLLHDELQTEPSAETKTLYQRLQDRLSNPTPPIPTTQHPTPITHNPLHVPFPISELIGREEETAEVASLLATRRLITLTGTGGIGKTRLALAVATRVAADFPQGVWFVDLSPVTDPAHVLPAVAHALEARETQGNAFSADTLREHLRDRKILLILDNAEHLLEACAALVTTWLEGLPELQVLVTSRRALGISGEQIWRVPSLSFPERLASDSRPLVELLLEYAAPRLFVTRALAASSAFVLTERNAPAILQICSRLDGIPLAIELTAARAGSLSVEQIGIRLEDSFRLLTTGSRTALPRQQTLRAMVDWSYRLLTELQQRAFRQLACFVGGWTVEAAEAFIGDDAIDHLATLIGQSLVIMETQPDGQTRYRLLETLRQYGQEKLRETGEWDEVRNQHRRYFLRFAQENDPNCNGEKLTTAMTRLRADYDNLRLALDGCMMDGTLSSFVARDGLEIAASLWRVWEARGDATEGRSRLTSLLAHPDTQGTTRSRASALYGAGMLAQMQSDYEEAYSLKEQSYRIYQALHDKEGAARVCSSMGSTRRRQGEEAEADALLMRGLTLQREIGDTWGAALTLANLGAGARRRSDYTQAKVFLEESLELRRALGDREGIAHVLANLGTINYEQGNYAAARRFHEESLALHRVIGTKTDIADSLGDLGIVAFELGDYPTAHRLQEESLTLRREIGDRWGIALALGNVGVVLFNEGDYAKSRMLLEESLALRRAVNDREGIALSLANLGDLAYVEGDYDRAFALHTESLALFRAQDNKYGATFLLMNLGMDCQELYRWDDAREYLMACLNLCQEIGSKRMVPNALEGLAQLALRLQQPERAAVLYGGATAQRQLIAVPRAPQELQEYNQAQSTLRNRLQATILERATTYGENLSLEQIVAFALDTTRTHRELTAPAGLSPAQYAIGKQKRK